MSALWIRPKRALAVRWAALCALCTGAVCAPSVARAGSMDFALERLVQNPGCRTDDGRITPGGETPCEGDQVAFKQLINQYALALAPTNMYPARTTGYGGFEILLEGAFTSIDSSQSYWTRGTRGPNDPTSGQAAKENATPASMLQMYAVRLRKGFGFGLEVGSTFGFLADTSIISGGVDVRMSLFEGFRSGVPGFFPDLAIAGSVRTLTGTSQVQITVPTASAVLSKPITIAGSGQLTPFIGFQYMWIFGDSGVIDFTPATDAQQYCNFTGKNQPGGPAQPVGVPGRDGSPVCEGGSAADFNNSHVFIPVRLERQRLNFGASYQYEIFTAGAQLSLDVVPPDKAQNSAEDRRDLAGQKSQLQFALQLGAIF